MMVSFSTRTWASGQYPPRIRMREGDMKFEPELLRSLLLYIEEEAKTVHSNIENIELDGWSAEEVTYHVVRAEDDGLITATIDYLPDEHDPDATLVAYSVHSLTSAGHGTLGPIRDPAKMREIKTRASALGANTAKLFWGVAEAYVLEQIKRMSGLS